MKKIFIIIAVTVIAGAGCKKSELDITNPNQATTQQF